jgi:hypothetical protein
MYYLWEEENNNRNWSKNLSISEEMNSTWLKQTEIRISMIDKKQQIIPYGTNEINRIVSA